MIYHILRIIAYLLTFVALNLIFAPNFILLFQPICNRDVWWIGDNPYENQNTPLKRMCSGGWVNLTGTNLTGIMKTMKFSYHSDSTDDISELEDIISRVNFTYTITSKPDVRNMFEYTP